MYLKYLWVVTMEKREIKDKKDVVLMVNLFYKQVRENKVIGPIFNEKIGENWDKHLPKMYSFWESLLFNVNSYKGNPLRIHKELNESFPLEPMHFEEWIGLFNETLNKNFKGDVAEKAKQRALSILTILKIKVTQNQ